MIDPIHLGTPADLALTAESAAEDAIPTTSQQHQEGTTMKTSVFVNTEGGPAPSTAAECREQMFRLLQLAGEKHAQDRHMHTPANLLMAAHAVATASFSFAVAEDSVDTEAVRRTFEASMFEHPAVGTGPAAKLVTELHRVGVHIKAAELVAAMGAAGFVAPDANAVTMHLEQARFQRGEG